MTTPARNRWNLLMVILVTICCTFLVLMAAGLFFIVLGWPGAIAAAVIGVLGTGTLAASLRRST